MDSQFCSRFIFISFILYDVWKNDNFSDFSSSLYVWIPNWKWSWYWHVWRTSKRFITFHSIEVFYVYYYCYYHFKMLHYIRIRCLFIRVKRWVHPQINSFSISWKEVILLVNLISYFIIVIIWLKSNCSFFHAHLEIWLFATTTFVASR